ncbi:MAG TPA: nitrate- and nitrite sensing domain-containing protein [Motilibacteraceae bacterium]|nr:nitrate- and nitrite sensing domain-containing protein [Motilibacteraceae bacterium]
MLRNLGIRSKLLALVAVPMALLLAVSLVVVAGARSQAVRAQQVEDLIGASALLDQTIHALQGERSATAAFVLDGRKDADGRLAQARKKTDASLDTVRAAIKGTDFASISPALAAGVAASAALHDQLPTTRKLVDQGASDLSALTGLYDRSIATDLGLASVVADVAGDQQLARSVRAYGALSTAIEANAQERDLLYSAYSRQRMDDSTYQQFASLLGQQNLQLATFRQLSSTDARFALDKALAQADAFTVSDQRQAAGRLLRGEQAGDPTKVAQAESSRIVPLVQLEVSTVSTVRDQAAAAASAATQRALLVLALALLGLLLAVLLALLMSRRIVAPLRRLTEAAGRIGEQLPTMVERMQTPGEGPGVELEPVAVESKDEIGRLAEAFNVVNATTVEVAQEQAALRASIAEMFVNVARRNQVLLGRQLSFIDQLEQREEDPDQLDNLFRLDHLATRMRRNAESLLVLAGIDGNRRLRRPMPLSDVVRTAASEIEQYERVDLSTTVDPRVSGRLALTTAHLLAELLENATHFSNPDTRVVVSSRLEEHGVGLTITDYGLGMSEEEVEAANERIAHPPVTEIAVAQRLGFYVVGRLAQRLGATVRLRRGRSSGIVVDLLLPVEVFEPGSVPTLSPAEPVRALADALAEIPEEAPAAPSAVDAPSLDEAVHQPVDRPIDTSIAAMAAAPAAGAEPVFEIDVRRPAADRPAPPLPSRGRSPLPARGRVGDVPAEPVPAPPADDVPAAPPAQAPADFAPETVALADAPALPSRSRGGSGPESTDGTGSTGSTGSSSPAGGEPHGRSGDEPAGVEDAAPRSAGEPADGRQDGDPQGEVEPVEVVQDEVVRDEVAQDEAAQDEAAAVEATVDSVVEDSVVEDSVVEEPVAEDGTAEETAGEPAELSGDAADEPTAESTDETTDETTLEASLSTTDRAARHGSRRSIFSFWRRRKHRGEADEVLPVAAAGSDPLEAVPAIEPAESSAPAASAPVAEVAVPVEAAASTHPATPVQPVQPGREERPVPVAASEPAVGDLPVAPAPSFSDEMSERAAVLEALSASLTPTVEERVAEPAPEAAPVAEPVAPFVTFRPAVDVLPQRGGGRRGRKGRQAEPPVPAQPAAPAVPAPVPTAQVPPAPPVAPVQPGGQAGAGEATLPARGPVVPPVPAPAGPFAGAPAGLSSAASFADLHTRPVPAPAPSPEAPAGPPLQPPAPAGPVGAGPFGAGPFGAGPFGAVPSIDGPFADAAAIAAGAELASAALTELSRLSSGYEPAFKPTPQADAGLARRRPREDAAPAAPAPSAAPMTARVPGPVPAQLPAAAPAAAAADPAPAARRSPEEVRSRLSGFRSGVERARTAAPAPGGHPLTDAPTTDTP